MGNQAVRDFPGITFLAAGGNPWPSALNDSFGDDDDDDDDNNDSDSDNDNDKDNDNNNDNNKDNNNNDNNNNNNNNNDDDDDGNYYLEVAFPHRGSLSTFLIVLEFFEKFSGAEEHLLN